MYELDTCYWGIVVDTNSPIILMYEEIGTYITGCHSEESFSATSKKIIKNFHKDKTFFDYWDERVSGVQDGRAYIIYDAFHSKDRKYNSVLIHTQKRPTEEDISMVKNRLMTIKSDLGYMLRPDFEVIGCRVVEIHTIAVTKDV